MHLAKGGGAQMCAKYISLCSNDGVILRARGKGVEKVPKTACILNQCPPKLKWYVKNMVCELNNYLLEACRFANFLPRLLNIFRAWMIVQKTGLCDILFRTPITYVPQSRLRVYKGWSLAVSASLDELS